MRSLSSGWNMLIAKLGFTRQPRRRQKRCQEPFPRSNAAKSSAFSKIVIRALARFST